MLKTNFKKIFVITFLFLMVVSPFFSTPAQAQPPAGLTGYSNWVECMAVNATNTGTNYQITAVIHYRAGTNYVNTAINPAEVNIFTSEVVQPDFDDVRFTADDGTTLLHQTISKIIIGDYARYDVKLTDDLSAQNVTYFIYYGDANAVRLDEPADVYLTGTNFDDYTSDSITNSTGGSQTLTIPSITSEQIFGTFRAGTLGDWIKYGPIITNGGGGWKNTKAEDLYIVQDSEGWWIRNSTGYRQGFFGGKSAEAGTWSIGMTFSNDEDGLLWTEYSGNPILTASGSGWREYGISSPNVIQYNSTHLAMIASGARSDPAVATDYVLGLLWSTDGGYTWTEDSHNPIMIPESGDYHWDANHNPYLIGAPTVSCDPWAVARYGAGQTGYILMFESLVNDTIGAGDNNWRNFGAVSQDMVTWTPLNGGNYVFMGSGLNDAWDKQATANPKIFKAGTNQAVIMYNGMTDDAGGGWSVSHWRLGFASTEDMNLEYANWTRYTNNPVINIGAGGSADDEHVKMDSIGRQGSTVFVAYYHGWDTTSTCQSYAAILYQTPAVEALGANSNDDSYVFGATVDTIDGKLWETVIYPKSDASSFDFNALGFYDSATVPTVNTFDNLWGITRFEIRRYASSAGLANFGILITNDTGSLSNGWYWHTDETWQDASEYWSYADVPLTCRIWANSTHFTAQVINYLTGDEITTATILRTNVHPFTTNGIGLSDEGFTDAYYSNNIYDRWVVRKYSDSVVNQVILDSGFLLTFDADPVKCDHIDVTDNTDASSAVISTFPISFPFSSGDSITFSVTAKAGYTFSYWDYSAGHIATNPTTDTFSVGETITAVFVNATTSTTTSGNTTITTTMTSTYIPPVIPSGGDLGQYLIAGDYFGFVLAVFLQPLGSIFYGIMAYAIAGFLYIRYQNLLATGIILVILGGLMQGTIGLQLAPVSIIILIGGIVSVIASLFGAKD
jgi:hypothetical protein